MKKYPFYIFVLSLYPALSLYASNMQELALLDAIFYACASLILAICLFYFFNYFLKNKEKTAFYLVIFLLIFFYFGLLRQYLNSLNPEIFKTRYLLPLVLSLLILLFIWIKKSLYRYEFIIQPLNVFSMIMILMVISQIGFNYKNVVWSFEVQIERNESKVPLSKSKTMPNVYFIILDEYASFRSIKQIYGYDNDNFKESLKKAGFFVAENSTTKYPDTTLSIPSVLNMKQVDKNTSMQERFNYYNNASVFKEFSDFGYETTSFGLFVYQNFLNPNTNNFYDNYRPESPFFESILEKSILELMYRKYKLEKIKAGDAQNIDRIQTIAKQNNQFVFMHYLLPHNWFRYLADGNSQSIVNALDYNDKNVYLEQYKYTTNLVTKLIENLIIQSPNSIIIIQSDHGIRDFSQPFANKEDIDREAHYILNAIYMPNGDYSGLKDDMENVDTFKILLPKIEKYIKEKKEIL